MKQHSKQYAFSIFLSSAFLLFLLSGCEMQGKTTFISDSTSASQERSSQNITTAGEYTFSGEINGTIVVNASEEDDVEIILDNATITSSDNLPPIYIQQVKDVKITLAKNSINTLTDNRSNLVNEEADDFPSAAIYSMSDLKIDSKEGAKLNIIANYNDGITSKDDLKIDDLTLTITAKDDAIRGKDSVEIKDSVITIDAGGDAIKSDNTDDEEKGVLTIESSNITLSAGDDGLKGVSKVDIMSGNIIITDSYEGIEGKVINIYDGEITLTSKDDGINISQSKSVVSSITESVGFGGKGGGNSVLEGGMVSIYGGTITLNTQGDGFDSNGNAQMTGGTLIINGPTNSGNGAIDVNGSFDISGGTVIAVGSSGMAETPDETSTQYSLQVNLDTNQIAGTVVSLNDASGNELFNYTTTKQFQSVTYSSPYLQSGATYSFLVNGEEYTTLTLDSMVTKYGEGERMGGGMRGGDMQGNMGSMDGGMRGMKGMERPDNWDTMTEEERHEYMDANRPSF